MSIRILDEQDRRELDARDEELNGLHYPVLLTEAFEAGGLNSSNGTVNDKGDALLNRVRTKVAYSEEMCIDAAEGVVFRLYFYAYDGNAGGTVTYIGAHDEQEGHALITKACFPEGATCYRILAKYKTEKNITSAEGMLTLRMSDKREAVTFEYGSISSGADQASAGRIRSGRIEVKDAVIIPEEGFQFSVNCYKSTDDWVKVSLSLCDKPVLLREAVADDTAYVRLVVSRKSNGTEGWAVTDSTAAYFQDLVKVYSAGAPEYAVYAAEMAQEAQSTVQEAQSAVQEAQSAIQEAQSAVQEAQTAAQEAQTAADEVRGLVEKEDPEYVDDAPENAGVLNALMNFKHLTETEWSTLARVPQRYGAIWANGTFKGIPYSSTRPEALFVPNNVSFHTFLTALKNPSSYLYTVDLVRDFNNTNGATYYGAVCSTACAYALGIVPNYSTHQWTQIPGMEVLANQSPQSLKLCDTIVTTDSTNGGHVVMVTGIKRDKSGAVGAIIISEAVNNFCKSTTYTPEELATEYPTPTYTYCRYSKLYAAPLGQPPREGVVYNTDIIPRKGDRANWLAGVPVEIDVLNAGTYTGVEVYKDGRHLRTENIASVVTLSDLVAGSYKARLTDGTNTSDWCYWMVVDAASTAKKAEKEGEVMVTFSASNATPLWVNWVRGDGDNHGTVYTSVISDADRANGQQGVIYTYEGPKGRKASLKLRVAFQTEYGIIHSPLSDAFAVG